MGGLDPIGEIRCSFGGYGWIVYPLIRSSQCGMCTSFRWGIGRLSKSWETCFESETGRCRGVHF